MKRFAGYGCWTVLSILFFTGFAAADPPPVGGQLPAFTLSVPDSPDHRAYLGISEQKSVFSVPDVAAPVAIIEIFSMYCPHCQREAPIVNDLYNRIQSRPDLKGEIKLIGIGAGNTQYEVNYFRDAYDIPFPLFPDPDFSLHGLMGEVRTPYFVAIRKEKGGGHRVIYSKLGGFGKPDAFLDLILQKSELE